MIEFLSFACAGYVHASYEYDNSSFDLEDLDHMDDDYRTAADDQALDATVADLAGPAAASARRARLAPTPGETPAREP